MVLATFLGCEKDLEYDIATSQPRLVVNSLFARDSLFRIEVSVSATPGQGDQILSLKNASIALLENNNQVDDFVLDSFLAAPINLGGIPNASLAPTKLFFHRSTNTIAKTGAVYAIKVDYPGYNEVFAQTTVPRQLPARKIDLPFDAAISVNGRQLNQLSFEIDDDGGKANYFAVELLAFEPGRQQNFQKIEFFSAEKAFSENLTVVDGQHSEGVFYQPENGVFFSNGKFQGLKKRFDLYVDPAYTQPGYSLTLRLMTLSPEFYHFATSYQKQRSTSGNPFAEPAQVYSNVIGGLGIFGGYSISMIEMN